MCNVLTIDTGRNLKYQPDRIFAGRNCIQPCCINSQQIPSFNNIPMLRNINRIILRTDTLRRRSRNKQTTADEQHNSGQQQH